MKKHMAALALFGVILFLGGTAGQDAAPSGPYKKWLEEEVPYLISSKERDVFLRLKTDRERDIFVEAFWKQRDPDPDTPRNEFKDEHYRRWEYASKIYGRGTPLPGWRTDRGRIYIVLGAPLNVEQYANVNGVYPTEIWFYQGNPALGLPTAFNVIFFRKDGTGDYILYSPTEHGPRSLIAEAMGGYRDVSRMSSSMSDDEAAYRALQNLEPNLARQTLSLIPGEPARPGYQSLASNRLIATIFDSPQKHVDVSYAEAILRYKDFVEVEYTANYIGSEASLHVVRDDSGVFLVHYTIEPGKITVENAEGRYEAHFQLNGRVSDEQGRTVYQFDKDFPFSLTALELEEVRSKSLSIQDAFPLVPGSYHFDILLKNSLSKEFTGADRKIVIPGAASSVHLSPLLLAYGVEKKAAVPGERVPFKIGDQQILCQTRKSFSSNDNLVLFFQIFGEEDELRSSGTLRFVYFKEDREFFSKTRRLADEKAWPDVLETQSLREFPPGYYQIRASLLDGQGRAIHSQKENFEISLSAAVPRPLVISKVTSSFRMEDDLYLTGVQYLNKGGLPEAVSRLAAAYRAGPHRAELALAYGQALFLLGNYEAAKGVLEPFAAGERPEGEILSLLGRTCHALGAYGEAAGYYEAYLSRVGMNVDILNFLGTCHFQLGRRDEALRVWTRSLEINPDQERIIKLVESLKKK